MFYYSNRIKELLKPSSTATDFEQGLYDKYIEQQAFWLKRIKNIEEDIAFLEDRKVPSSNQFNFEFDASKWGKPAAGTTTNSGWGTGSSGWGNTNTWGSGGGGWGTNWGGANNTTNTVGTETSAASTTATTSFSSEKPSNE